MSTHDVCLLAAVRSTRSPWILLMDRSYIHTSTDILADFGAEVVEGRGTRVFEGYRKGDSDKTPVVIKDTWRECDRRREDVILKEAFTDIVNVMGRLRRKLLRSIFSLFLMPSTWRSRGTQTIHSVSCVAIISQNVSDIS
ncbi:hypothetical protein SCLCIDRAFT_967022 [Scleroderma citrinum Foug A]|uniref:Fungal-type protein kinase domain-containing protein n=1 Tax=Scleroderma citrinum Foug A TaxID=1036808 RepID=A0A0C3A6B1_9AGAM|nr:hypothetical protein SCLCIDRAFT_967022 [Scleroderma citrinum Foug A]